MTLIFAATIPMAMKASKMNGQYSQAVSLCQHKIDQLRAIGYGRVNSYDELSDAEIIDLSPTSSPYSFTTVDEVRNYLPESTASLRVQVLGTDRLKIIATVTWKTTTYEPKPSSASLSAVITNVE